MVNTLQNILPRLFVIIALAMLLSCQSEGDDKLIIATAANAQFAIEAIASEFEKETGIESLIIVGSSGKHTAQIEAGAPYDVFVSADLKFPDKLYKLGLTVTEPAIYAWGKLVIWTLKDSLSTKIQDLSTIEVDHIAMPNPKTAPYGKAAREALDYYEIYDGVSSRLVFGESVAQTNQFILSESAAIGFTAASVVMAPAMQSKGRWQEVDKNAYAAIAQGAVVMKQSDQIDIAKKFYLFLFSPKAKNILQAHGYTTDKNSQ